MFRKPDCGEVQFLVAEKQIPEVPGRAAADVEAVAAQTERDKCRPAGGINRARSMLLLLASVLVSLLVQGCDQDTRRKEQEGDTGRSLEGLWDSHVPMDVSGWDGSLVVDASIDANSCTCLAAAALRCGSGPVVYCIDGVCDDRAGPTQAVCDTSCRPGRTTCQGANRWLLRCNEKGNGWERAELCDFDCSEGECIRGDPTAADSGHPTDADAGSPEELCNGVDDDGDGRFDEGIQSAGPCTNGVGACTRDGELRCEEGRVSCTAVAVSPVPEICNARDDDCDHQIDEDIPEEPCIIGQGACELRGRRVCRNGRANCDVDANDLPTENCNGMDDNCDGRVDEGLQCPWLSGNWQWTMRHEFEQDGSHDFRSIVALDEDPAAGEATGISIDDYGVSEVSGTIDQQDLGFSLTKNYLSGDSVGGEYEYMGTVIGLGEMRELDGAFVQVGQPQNVGPMHGEYRGGFAPQFGSGRWNIEASFGPAVAQLIVSPSGRVDGTMEDEIGDATLVGVLDLSNGEIRFRKQYRDSGEDFWYFGVVGPGGLQIEDGTYRETSDGPVRGQWSARK